MTKLVGPTRRHDPLHFRGLRLCPVFPRNLGKAHNAPRRLVSAGGIAFARAGKGEASSSPPKEAPDRLCACGEGALGAEHLRLAVRSPSPARGRGGGRVCPSPPDEITLGRAGKTEPAL